MVEIVDFVGCGGGCGLWRFLVVVEVVVCFVVVGVGLGCRIGSRMWLW